MVGEPRGCTLAGKGGAPLSTLYLLRRGGDLCLLIEIGILPKSLLSAGKSGTRAGVIEGAIGGAGVTMLFVLCLCLVFFT